MDEEGIFLNLECPDAGDRIREFLVDLGRLISRRRGGGFHGRYRVWKRLRPRTGSTAKHRARGKEDDDVPRGLNTHHGFSPDGRPSKFQSCKFVSSSNGP